MSESKPGILLDWDGVLCDSLVIYFELYRNACARHGKPFPIKDMQHFRAWYNPQWEINYQQMGFSEQEFQEVLAHSKDHLDYQRASLFESIAPTLRGWAQQFPMAIVSTTPSPLIHRRLVSEGLQDLFQIYAGGDDGKSEKRQKVGRTLQQLGTQSGVMVGDTPLDIDAGKFNGLATVGVTYGWVTAERIRQCQPDIVIDHPSQLDEAVRRLLAELAKKNAPRL